MDFLAKITPDTQAEHLSQMQQYNLGEDCPIFDGLFDFCRLYTGGSIDGAVRLNHGLSDIAINWSGGLHHAKKAEVGSTVFVMAQRTGYTNHTAPWECQGVPRNAKECQEGNTHHTHTDCSLADPWTRRAGSATSTTWCWPSWSC